jgi:hypothetical protein
MWIGIKSPKSELNVSSFFGKFMENLHVAGLKFELAKRGNLQAFFWVRVRIRVSILGVGFLRYKS